MKKRFSKVIISTVLVVCLFLGGQQYIFAENIDVEQEYLDKKAAGEEVYEIKKENGDFVGYYEPYSDGQLSSNAKSGITSNIGKWVIPSNTTVWSNTKHSWLKGDKITVNISQTPSGAGYLSYLALRDADDGAVIIVSGSATTNGWDGGIITIGYNGHFNFAIDNTSAHSITYTGTFTY